MNAAVESEYTPWEGQAWPKSPRNSSQQGWSAPRNSRRQQQPHKGGKKGTKSQKGKQKGKEDAGKGQGASLQAPAPPPPLTGPNAVAAPWMGLPPPPGNAMPSAPSPSEQRLSEVLTLLQKQDQDSLSTDLQAFVLKEGAKAKQGTAKQLHSAVTEMTRAEKAMDAAVSSRANLIASWRTFLAASLQTWREYTTQFQMQEKKCQEEIAAAREALQKAKEKAEEGFIGKKTQEDGEATETISDDEDAQTQTVAASERILGGLVNMTNNLKQLSDQAEQEHQEAQRRVKRPRKDQPDDAEMPGGHADGSGLPEQPASFGKPGH